jgi:glycosyltransferase involved in cell wall biosynthesis
VCYENSPTVIYEAYLVGIPVIASRIGGITELIHNLGGLLFRPGNKDDLTYQMKWLMNNYDEIVKKLKKNKSKLNKYNIKNYINKILKT